MTQNYDKAFHYAYLIGQMKAELNRSIRIIEESNHPAKEFYLESLKKSVEEFDETFNQINSRQYKNNEQI